MKVIEKIHNRIIQSTLSILQALKKMDEVKVKMLFVFDNDRFLSILTIGDIQRAIINQVSLCEQVCKIIDVNKQFSVPAEPIEQVRQDMMSLRAECMPVVDNDGMLVDVYLWDELFESSELENRKKIDLPVVIMAGGKGTRLKPITNVIPKPLVPIGEKTILEVIMDQFESIGCKKFYMSVNYKANMMEFYLSQLDHKYDIEFFVEDKPLGTIGSVSLLKGKITTPFFVSNCDSINEQDYRDVYDYHINNKNDMTIVTMVKSFKIPYGVIETGEDGLMVSLKEKPEHTVYKTACLLFIMLAQSSQFLKGIIINYAQGYLPAKYEEMSFSTNYAANILIYIIPLLIALFCWYYSKVEIDGKYNKDISLMFMFISCVIFFINMMQLNNQLGRMSFYFTYSYYILIPYAFKCMPTNARVLLQPLMLSVCIAFFIIGSIGDIIHIDEYHFFWEDFIWTIRE